MAFNEQKTAQMAAFFLDKRGGQMSILKLTKLLYLADRAALDRYGVPMTGDKYVSMPHGPVLSTTYDLLTGTIESHSKGWEYWVSDREDHEVLLNHPIEPGALDELSPADIEVLTQVWDKFGGMKRWALRDYTHAHCPEWRDPQGSSIPIHVSDILRALGKSEEEAHALEEELSENEYADRVFSRL